MKMADKRLSTSIIDYDGTIAYLNDESYHPDSMVDTRYYYVVSRLTKDLYSAHAVPESTNPATIKNMRLPFPPDWRGANTDTLRNMTHISDIISCDTEGEWCTARTLEGVVKAARLSLSGVGHYCYQCPWACPAVCRR